MSRAHKLAKLQVAALTRRYNIVVDVTNKSGHGARRTAFEQLLEEGRAAISVSLSACVSILQTGSFKTVFELAADDAGCKVGPRYVRALRKRLGKFYEQRIELERILRMDGYSKYASLRVGGPGPDYGPCCIVLECSSQYVDATCFAGDSITAVFGGGGRPALAKRSILERFAPRSEVVRLGAAYNHDLICDGDGDVPLDPNIVGELLSNRNALVEIHVHEQIVLSDISKIYIARSVHDGIKTRLGRYKSASRAERQTMQYDDVRVFLAVHELAANRGVRVMAVPG